mgnify:FL=1
MRSADQKKRMTMTQDKKNKHIKKVQTQKTFSKPSSVGLMCVPTGESDGGGGKGK